MRPRSSRNAPGHGLECWAYLLGYNLIVRFRFWSVKPGSLPRFQRLPQPLKLLLKRGVVFPVRKIRDEVLAHLDGQVFAGVRVKAGPFLACIEICQPDRTKL